MDSMARDGSVDDAEKEILELEARLKAARGKLNDLKGHTELPAESLPSRGISSKPSLPPSPSQTNHYLLLLSDSALPLGSFAFSSGLESYLAHTRPRSSFNTFLPESISAYASTTLPFVLAAHRSPSDVADLDDELDAAIICTVGRRASIAQGRALLSIWERSFASSLPAPVVATLQPYAALLKTATSSRAVSATADDQAEPPLVFAHLAPLFGAICNLVGLTLQQTAYIFMMGHVKALISAAVRASMFGPYQAQKVLASTQVQQLISAAIEREWSTPVERAGQTMPVMDLWIGRHEVLYSRIFNS
ncbi:urease [Colletotrichum paranaense]|uniref:Urease n=3 Tax=Colletotrichum acutatum species complex TaxID=2707335 RepID=A0AAI9Z9Z9_9PEZI|nr:urease [Colletotrichum costaricense]XP_060349154.1 urease [Colletotrichum paranaense]KAK1482485.1 urease [Colletotrichum cuscutae]KAK1538403.1 urease [Colletotrichum paranaense]KAK1539601.1 urease [Colletotrichum costaricense]